jgi:hypothetical protein
MRNTGEIREKGLKPGDYQMKLLEKIEELTLYTVEQAKTIQTQQTIIQDHKIALDQKDADIAALKSHNAAIDARLAALEQMMKRWVRQEDREEK